MPSTFRRPLTLGLLTCLALLAGGCLFHPQRQARGTSIVRYLYPDDTYPLDTPTVPVLALPLRVGLAFVPPTSAPDLHLTGADGFSDSAKVELLRTVSERFRALPYVKSIEIIPPTYLRPGGGFANLDQLKSMLGIDVIALVSHDQVQFTDGGLLSLAYWTVVGAYVVQGEKNDTQTLMETAVYDIASRRLLFRAPGTSQIRASSTPVNHAEQLRADSAQGFAVATEEMIGNLQVELEAFRERVKAAPDEYRVVHRPGYTGAGAFGGWSVWPILAALGLAAWKRR